MRCEAIAASSRRQCCNWAKSTVLDREGHFRDVCGVHRRCAGYPPSLFVTRTLFMERARA